MSDLALPLARRQRTVGSELVRRTRRRLGIIMPLANLDGGLVVFFLTAFVLPITHHHASAAHVRWVNFVAFVIYMAICVGVAFVWNERYARPIQEWLLSNREPTAEDRARVMHWPKFEALVAGTLWAGAAILFPAINWQFGHSAAIDGGIAIILAGISTATLCFLLAERLLRPMSAAVLATQPPEESACLGVASRMLLSWLFCTGIPVLGILLAFAGRGDAKLSDLVAPTYFLVAIALSIGLAGTWFATRSVADPLATVREAMLEVGEGRTNVSVTVYDGSEVGLLQAGFNQMVAGLRERQLLQDLFGRHVGEDVARQALERGVELGGETRDVAVLFVDVVGSTRLAAQRAPADVVRLLNQFFSVVVEVVERYGGSVNKFEGDAVLAVFGAPAALDDCYSAALGAAREMRERLAAIDDLDVGIGVSAGPVVAGNVGAETRYEYTVIGDPVNEAARLTELAKSRPERLLASGAVVRGAAKQEADRWRGAESVLLRGRLDPTDVAVPAA